MRKTICSFGALACFIFPTDASCWDGLIQSVWFVTISWVQEDNNLNTPTQPLLTPSSAPVVKSVPLTLMLLMQERPRLWQGAVAIVNTKGCGSKQPWFVFTLPLLEMTDVPISPGLGIRGRGGGTGAPCITKRPLGLQRKVTDPYCSSFRPSQWLFHWFRLQRLSLSQLMSMYANGQML